MGIGNYYLDAAESVYIDKEAVYGKGYWEDDEKHFDDFSFLFSDLICHILEALPSCFHKTKHSWLDRERLLIAESGLFRVSIVDWDWCFSLNIEVIDDRAASSLAAYHLSKTATAIFDKLSQVYDLQIRTSAWTSGKRPLPELSKAAWFS